MEVTSVNYEKQTHFRVGWMLWAFISGLLKSFPYSDRFQTPYTFCQCSNGSREMGNRNSTMHFTGWKSETQLFLASWRMWPDFELRLPPGSHCEVQGHIHPISRCREMRKEPFPNILSQILLLEDFIKLSLYTFHVGNVSLKQLPISLSLLSPMPVMKAHRTFQMCYGWTWRKDRTPVPGNPQSKRLLELWWTYGQ